MLKARVTFRVMKLGHYVTVDDGGNYVTERSHKDKKNNNNSSQRELGPPVCSLTVVNYVTVGDEFRNKAVICTSSVAFKLK